MLKLILITLIINTISTQNNTETEKTEKDLNITDEKTIINKTNENITEEPEEKLSDFNKTLRELNNTNFTKYKEFMSDIKNLTLYEKDRILTCIELSSMLIDAEEEYINGNLTQNTSLKRQGMKEIISMEMMKNCINNINETLVNLMYQNLTRVVNISGIDDSEIDYMKVNYSYFGHLDYFQLNEEYQKFILRINYVKEEYIKKWEEPISEEELEKRRKKKEEMQNQILEMLKNRTYNNSNYTESEEDDEDDSYMYDSAFIYKYDENGNFVEVNVTEEKIRKRKEREEKRRKEKEEKEKKEKEEKNETISIDKNEEKDNKINNNKTNDNEKEKKEDEKKEIEEKEKKEEEKKEEEKKDKEKKDEEKKENKEEKEKKEDEKSDL